ncbi:MULTISPECIES: (2Fe-2S) ferredoxin domain-containing protein [unclassified Candidatus Frackibacter]|uniref:(2Fe-2S) ferredoxin domain-containing protein n=1 Tax=unclassified Candidatus Frackibacter TaxID=2648818 RepID=UPI0008886307|nr:MULTISPECIES: (2Fe-2S) ferredoxin domain-containing protein [unclassified Candidatus Frackibacter]SDC71946.1 NAD(P)-dependent iron-only hydrogenase iron-sulfur protein [Candidatus Frackibacter sp. WG11]SEM86245.1 NAD(P)-dependent iron-only hydrogenase iron-sulfur protein [Candidatus Frackibacter sp. WG12]SFL95323.1 NAD(P)-dependent iron-only hydrogenase iron-sulfur protein [Candidatus Frackibacter sp. WG13]
MKSLAELQKLKEEVESKIKLRHQEERIRVIVGMGTCGIAAGARDIINKLSDEIDKRNLGDITLTQVGCMGLCEKEPIIKIEKKDGSERTYGNIKADRVQKLVSEELVNERAVENWLITK